METVTMGGKKWTVSALVLNDWQYLEEMAIRHYRREKLKTVTQNADLLRESGIDVDTMIREKIEELDNISVQDLPRKNVVMPIKNDDGSPFSLDENGVPRSVTQLLPYQMWFASNTVEGLALTLWRSLLKEHPNVTLDEVEQMTNDESEKAAIEAAANRVGVISQPESAKNE